MAGWGEFAAAAPELAARGGELIFELRGGEAMLVTVPGNGLPRMHPVTVGVVDGALLVFTQERSAKTRDLATDGRYALHAHQDPARPHEFLVRGRARRVDDAGRRAAAVADWAFDASSGYVLFELDVERALFGERGDLDAWPPRYDAWRDPASSPTP